MTAVKTRWGIFGTDWRNPADPFVRRRRAAENVSIFWDPRLSDWRRSCPYEWRVSRVSSRSLFDRADAGGWAKRQLAVQGLVSRHHVRGVSASRLDDVSKHERRRQLQHPCRRSGRVCSRRCAAHHCCSRRAERPRSSSVPIVLFAYWVAPWLWVGAAAAARRTTARYRPPNL